MNSEIKKRWLLDLRDGTRIQGHDTLRDLNGHQCCLDVLMEQGAKAGIVPQPVYDPVEQCWGYRRKSYEFEIEDGAGEYTDEFSVLSSEVMEWAGLDSTDPTVLYPGDNEVPAGVRTLSACNDALSLPFDKIANLIEDQL